MRMEPDKREKYSEAGFRCLVFDVIICCKSQPESPINGWGACVSPQAFKWLIGAKGLYICHLIIPHSLPRQACEQLADAGQLGEVPNSCAATAGSLAGNTQLRDIPKNAARSGLILERYKDRVQQGCWIAMDC